MLAKVKGTPCGRASTTIEVAKAPAPRKASAAQEVVMSPPKSPPKPDKASVLVNDNQEGSTKVTTPSDDNETKIIKTETMLNKTKDWGSSKAYINSNNYSGDRSNRTTQTTRYAKVELQTLAYTMKTGVRRGGYHSRPMEKIKRKRDVKGG